MSDIVKSAAKAARRQLTGLLTAEPAAPVRTLDELLAIAFALEQEAATRYGELAAAMREQGALPLAGVFDHLAELERSHVDAVTHWSQQQSGRAPAAADIAWELPETFDDETAGEIAASRLMTPYRALSMAVRNEERAFTFWSYVAAQAEAAQVRQAAEAMAHEELGHVSLLRRERRRAYHAERDAGPPAPRTADDVLADAARLESGMADRLAQLAAGAGPNASDKRLHDLAAQSRQMAGALVRFAAPLHDGKKTAQSAPDIVATAELLVERYLDIADHAQDEALIAEMQSLAGRAIARLGLLRLLVPRDASPASGKPG